MRSLDESIELNKQQWHTIEIVVDRLVLDGETERSRVLDSVETSLRYGDGRMLAVDADSGEEQVFSEQFACPYCGISFAEIEPRTFSFNSPHGACPTCSGLGHEARGRPRAHRAGRIAQPGRRRDTPVVARGLEHRVVLQHPARRRGR